MSKTLRYSIFTILSLFIVITVGVFLIHNSIKNKVENFLTNRIPANIENSYSTMDLDMQEGTLTFNKLSVSLKNRETDSIHTQVTADKLIIEDVSYWDYLFHKEIHIEDIKLKTPRIVYYKQHYKAPKDTTRKPLLKLFKPVRIDELSIDNATIHIFDATEDPLVLYGENVTLEVDDILISSETLKNRMPIEFGDYDAKSDSTFVKINPYEDLTAKNFLLKDHTATFTDISLITKYSRSRLSEIISRERDHFNISAEKITVEGIDFGFTERRFFAKSSRLTIQSPEATVYRDKLVADDPEIKKLYSAKLRELQFDLTVDEVQVENASLSYRERVHAGNHGGEVRFHDLSSTVKNASNTYKPPVKTTIETTGLFMENTPIQVQWDFDVNDPSDRFLFQTTVGSLDATVLNDFTQPNMGVKLSGRVHKIYTTIDGTHSQSHADMKINYDNFKVTVLRGDRKKKNRLLSAVANLFISNDSDKKEDNFREASYEVTPDRTKSVFNYVWLNVMEGLLKCVI
jgi:hypothetical protein